MIKFKHVPYQTHLNDYYIGLCKYCGVSLVADIVKSEYFAYNNFFQECISDDEKIIKDLLE